MIKQFKTGKEAKIYLICAQQILDHELRKKHALDESEIGRVEYGFTLNEAVDSVHHINDVNWIEINDINAEIPEAFQSILDENEKILQGSTIKFRLRAHVNERIDQLTILLAEQLGVRVYRALAVKLYLKRFFLLKTDQLQEI